VAVLEEHRHENRPDVPGAAGDENVHPRGVTTAPLGLDSKAL
jgi:hypothetical protein